MNLVTKTRSLLLLSFATSYRLYVNDSWLKIFINQILTLNVSWHLSLTSRPLMLQNDIEQVHLYLFQTPSNKSNRKTAWINIWSSICQVLVCFSYTLDRPIGMVAKYWQMRVSLKFDDIESIMPMLFLEALRNIETAFAIFVELTRFKIKATILILRLDWFKFCCSLANTDYDL